MSAAELFDDDIERAWEEFETGLTDLLGTTHKGDSLVLTSLDTRDALGAAPYVKVLGVGPGKVRAVVSSNASLHPRYQLSPAQEEALGRGGWKEPWEGRNGADFASMTTAKQHARIAAMVATALRDVLGVPHPALVQIEGLDDAGRELLGIVVPPAESPVGASPEGPHGARARDMTTGVVIPRDVDHLRELVDSALEPLAGPSPRRCEHGGVLLQTDSTQIVVHADDVDVVQIEALIVQDLQDELAALRETALLNDSVGLVRFVVSGRDIYLQAELLSRPFVSSHLRDVVMLAGAVAAERSPRLLTMTRGIHPVGPAADAPAMRPVVDPLATTTGPHAGIEELPEELVQLVAIAGMGPVSPEVAAQICGNDPTHMTSLVALAEVRAATCSHWARMFRAQGDDCSALDLEIEAERLHAAVTALRAASRPAR